MTLEFREIAAAIIWFDCSRRHLNFEGSSAACHRDSTLRSFPSSFQDPFSLAFPNRSPPDGNLFWIVVRSQKIEWLDATCSSVGV